MKAEVFLPAAPLELKNKLQRLIELSLPPVGPRADLKAPLWSAEFFGVTSSSYWSRLSPPQQQLFLQQNSVGILQEAIAIEHAGIAYAHRMALSARSQEERHYYTTVAREELEHLHWLKPFISSQESGEIPSFARFVGQLVMSEDRLQAILLIQVLLEGWGIHYYSSLVQNTEHVEIKKVFEDILRDESRHHAGGILLFEADEVQDVSSLLKTVQSLVDTIRIGPFQVAGTLGVLAGIQNVREMENLLQSLHAEQSASAKLLILRRLLAKVLKEEKLKEISWTPFSLDVVAKEILESEQFKATCSPPSKTLET